MLLGRAVAERGCTLNTGAACPGLSYAAVRDARPALCLVLADLGLILSGRSGSRSALHGLRSRNPALWAVVGGAVVLLALVLAIPGLRDLFRFSALHLDDIGLAVGVAVLTLPVSDGMTLLGRSRTAGVP